MRSVKSGLFVMATAGFFGTLAAVGCSAGGAPADVTSQAPTEPAAEPTNTLPPVVTTPPKNAGAKPDASTFADAGQDAGPPPSVAGDPCSNANDIVTKPCGRCGVASTICQNTTGTLTWQPYSGCENQKGECEPGTTVTEACGKCGTLTKSCNQYCGYTSAVCIGEPPSSCEPGTVEYTSAGCPANSNSYKSHVCAATCTFGDFSLTCAEPNNPNKMTASETVSTSATTGIVTASWTLDPAQKMFRPIKNCPAGSISTFETPYVAVEVKNPSTTLTATVSLFHSGTPTIDTKLWVYNKAVAPTDEASIEACDFGVADICGADPNLGETLPPCSKSSFSPWAGISKITIPPAGRILVYNAGSGADATGPFTLTVRTDKLQ